MKGILLSSQEMRDCGGCTSFKPSDDMIARMTKAIYLPKTKDLARPTVSSLIGDEDSEDDENVFDDS